MAEIKSLTGILSQSQLSGIVADLVNFIKAQDTNSINSVKEYVDGAIEGVNGDNTALAGRVKTNEDAIALLNNGSSVAGSVDYKIAQAFNDFATKVSNDNVVNTFKEMIDYVAAHGTEYSNLAALVGTLPSGSGVTTVVAYAEKVAQAAQAEADARIKAIEDDYLKASDKTALTTAIETAEQNAKNYADGLAGNYDAAGAAKAVQGNTDATIADCVTAINAFALATEAEINAIKALIK